MQYFRFLSFMILVVPFVISLPTPTTISQGVKSMTNPVTKHDRTRRALDSRASRSEEQNVKNTPTEQKRSIGPIGEIEQVDPQQSSDRMAELETQFLPKRSNDPTAPTPQDMVRELGVFSRVEERSMNMKEQQESTSTLNEHDMRSEEESFL